MSLLDKKNIKNASALLLVVYGFSNIVPLMDSWLMNEIFGLKIKLILNFLIILIGFRLFKQNDL